MWHDIETFLTWFHEWYIMMVKIWEESNQMYYMYQGYSTISPLRNMWQCNYITFENLIKWCTLKYILSQTYSHPSFRFIWETSRRRLWAVIENMISPDHVLCKKYSMTRQSKHCGFCIYIFDNSFDQSKSMVRLVRAEKMVLSGLVFAWKIARMIFIQNI